MDEMSNFPNLGEATVADVCRTELKLSPARQAADPRQISASCVTPNSCGEKLVCFRNVTRGARARSRVRRLKRHLSFQEVVEKNLRHSQDTKRKRRGDDGESADNDSILSTSSNLEPFANDDLGERVCVRIAQPERACSLKHILERFALRPSVFPKWMPNPVVFFQHGGSALNLLTTGAFPSHGF